MPVERSTYHYRSRRAGQAQLTERIKEIAATCVRYGHRRFHVLLRRDGWRVNAKRAYRLYREMGLQLGNKSPRPSSFLGTDLRRLALAAAIAAGDSIIELVYRLSRWLLAAVKGRSD